MKKLLAFASALFCVLPAFAKISFENPDISSKDEVVYIVDYKTTGSWSYKSVFYSKLNENTPDSKKQILSCFPERMELLSLLNKPVLQIRNRYGIARYYVSTDSISWVKQLSDIPLSASVTTPYASSSDGKWICYISKSGTATGKLILESTSTDKKIELCDDILFSYDKVPVKWSPDGSILVYEKKRKRLFLFS